METLTTLKVIHMAATVLLLLSGLGLALLAWRKRSAGPAITVQRPVGVRMVVDGDLPDQHAVYRLVAGASGRLAAGADLDPGFQPALHRRGAVLVLAGGAAQSLAQGEGGSLNFTLALAVVSLVGFVAIAGLMGAKPV